MIVASILACILLCSSIEQSKYKRMIKITTLSVIFTYYCFLLIYLLFLSRCFMYILKESDGLLERIRRNTNLIPFRTIHTYLDGALKGERIAITNLLGNLLAFMPMAFFLPTYYKKLKKLFSFILCMFGIILVVEMIQAGTNTGFLDIDDLILNLLGAIIAFLLCKLKFIQTISSTIHS